MPAFIVRCIDQASRARASVPKAGPKTGTDMIARWMGRNQSSPRLAARIIMKTITAAAAMIVR